ncbi:hypothetical protein RHO12_03220 [Orbus sturtevantii]|uniref:Rz1-like lysis system protein LysC n=1 Tax=Orbus sturtevantii TaxID=3074109 RepID=UPI00370D3760
MERIKYVYINAPSSLTQENNEPHIEKVITWGDCPLLYVDLKNSLKQCNADKKAIRELDNNTKTNS